VLNGNVVMRRAVAVASECKEAILELSKVVPAASPETTPLNKIARGWGQQCRLQPLTTHDRIRGLAQREAISHVYTQMR
jgi:hypothetical protein